MEHDLELGTLSQDVPKNVPKIAQINLVSGDPQVYEPCDDSFALVDALLSDRSNLIDLNPRFCLEIGSGSGYVITSLALILSQLGQSAQFFATDINPKASQTTYQTLKSHNIVNCEVLVMDIAMCLQKRLNKSFDLIVINPPYVPTPENEVGREGIVSSWAGGVNGRKVIDRILLNISEFLSDKGWAYMVSVLDNNPGEICRVMRERGFGSRIVLKRSTEEESLYVIKFWREKEKTGADVDGSGSSWFGQIPLVSSLLRG